MKRLNLTKLLVTLMIMTFAISACVIVNEEGPISDGNQTNTNTNTNFITNIVTNTVYVSLANGNDANDGLSPSSPVRTIEKGLQIAKNNSDLIEVRVTKGTYNITSNFVIEMVRNSYNKLTISGGWREDFSQNDDYTTINGDGSVDTVLVIRYSTNINIEKFIITGGKGTSSGYPGGVTVFECRYISIDAIIQNNTGGSYGSGICVSYSPDTTIKGLIAYNITTNSDHPSVYIGSSPFTTLEADVISNCGGVFIGSSEGTVLLGRKIISNGGVPLNVMSTPSIYTSNLTIENNSGYPVKIFASDLYVSRNLEIHHDVELQKSALRSYNDYNSITIYGNLYLKDGSEIAQVFSGDNYVYGNVYIEWCTNLIFTNIHTTNIIYLSNSVGTTIDVMGDPRIQIYLSKDTTVKGGYLIRSVNIKSSTNTTISNNGIGWCSEGGVWIEDSISNLISAPVININNSSFFPIFITNSLYAAISGYVNGNTNGGQSSIYAINSAYIKITNNVNNNQSGQSIIYFKDCSNVTISSPQIMLNQSGSYSIYLTNVDQVEINGIIFTNTYISSGPAVIALYDVTNLSIVSNWFWSNPKTNEGFTPIYEFTDIKGHVLKENWFDNALINYYHDHANGDLESITDVNNPLKTGATDDSTNNHTF